MGLKDVLAQCSFSLDSSGLNLSLKFFLQWPKNHWTFSKSFEDQSTCDKFNKSFSVTSVRSGMNGNCGKCFSTIMQIMILNAEWWWWYDGGGGGHNYDMAVRVGLPLHKRWIALLKKAKKRTSSRTDQPKSTCYPHGTKHSLALAR